MKVVCSYCGVEFNRKPSAIGIKNFCCKKHHSLFMKKGRRIKCSWCGTTHYRPPSKQFEHSFCSQKCRLEWFGKWTTEVINVKGHSKGHKARHLTKLNKMRNPLLALESDILKRGEYKRSEHRKIAEQILGRKLRKNEEIHHINGIHDDNRPENLMVIERKEHMKLHWNLLKQKGGGFICQEQLS